MMQPFQTSYSSTGSTLLMLLNFLVILVLVIFWMVVGWRAMRAHERIAQSLEQHPPV
jgi:uncharacterized membrane protein